MNKLDLEKYLEAYTFSFKLHKKQIRKGSNIPYFTHLSSVSNLIIENNGTTTQAIAGLLHDAVEDQGGIKTLAIIKKKFGPKVAKIVGKCSDTSIDPKPRHLRDIFGQQTFVKKVDYYDSQWIKYETPKVAQTSRYFSVDNNKSKDELTIMRTSKLSVKD